MSTRLLTLSVALLAATAVLSCGPKPPASGTADTTAHAAGPDAATVVAELDGKRITLRDLDAEIAGELSEVRQQEYEVRRRGLEKLIEDRLIDKEAARRGVTKEALVKAEVDDKMKMPSQGEVDALYQMHKARFMGRTREEAMGIIQSSIARQARAEREREFRAGLRQANPVKIALDAPRTKVEIPADAPTRGPADAKVTLVEFLDYGCGYCKRAHTTVEDIMKRYDGKVRFVHRDYPLSPDGPTVNAARAVRCAGDQDKLWEYHEDLLVSPGTFDTPDLSRRAKSLGLDDSKFASCMASGKHDAAIQKSSADGQELGVSSTPTFFINGRKISGAQPIDTFVQVIDEELGS
jgi:protein-disulfide isomerase